MSDSTATPRSKGELEANCKPMKASTKPVIKVDSSFAAPKWPTIESSQQDIILKLLCNLLEPIGHHKLTYKTPSKGKRSKKRKRVEEQRKNEQKINEEENQIPPIPSISKYITMGYNSTFRHLQETIKPSRSQGMAKDETSTTQPTKKRDTRKAEIAGKANQGHDLATASQSDEAERPKLSGNPHLSTIFLTAPSPSIHPPYTPLPLLAALSSKNHPALPPTRLISLSTSSEAKLCAALGIPRVGLIGIFEDTPGAKGLVEYVRENMETIDVPWIKETGNAEWLGTRVMFGEERTEG